MKGVYRAARALLAEVRTRVVAPLRTEDTFSVASRFARRAALPLIAVALATASQIAIARPVVVACPLWEAYPYRAGDGASATREYYEAGYFTVHPECEGIATLSCLMYYTNTIQSCIVTFLNPVGTFCQMQEPAVYGTGITGINLKNSDGSLYLSGNEPHSSWCGYNESDSQPLTKNLGDDDPCPNCSPGQPINTRKPINSANGNKFLREVDYARTGPGGLEFIRYYNSLARGGANVIGAQWSHNWQRSIAVLPWGAAMAYRADGKALRFTGSGVGVWAGEPEFKMRLENLGGAGWALTTSDEQVEFYDSSGRLVSVVDREGRATTLSYSTGGSGGPVYLDGAADALPPGLLVKVEDFTGRSLQFDYYRSGLLGRITDPTGRQIKYDFVPVYVGTSIINYNLGSVTYPVDGDPAGEKKTYFYNEQIRTQNLNRPSHLTGSDDGRTSLAGEAHSSFFEYDTSYEGKAIKSGRLGDVEVEQVSYPSSTMSKITDTKGTVRDAGYSYIQGVARRTFVDTPGLPRASTTYDANGNIASYTDANGNLTCYSFDAARNLETSRTEGLASSGTCESRVTTNATRTIGTEWHPTLRLVKRTAEPLRITTFSYHDEPGVSCAPAGASMRLLCSKSVQATTDVDGSLAFSAATDGPARVWSYAYNAQGQLVSADGPRTDVADTTTNAYYATNDPAGNFRAGDLQSTTNAKGQSRLFTHYDGAGRLTRMVDPNGLETLLDYWPRGWLKSRSMGSAAAGYETTSYEYGFVGNLKKITMPDASFIEYGYDDAHRLTSMSDGLGNSITYMLDGAGNREVEEARDIGGILVRKHTREFDALNRLWKDIGGTNPATQVTQYGFDANGNPKTTLDPLGRTTTQMFDARDRLREVRDPFNGPATPTKYDYNGQDQLTRVEDPKGLATTYSVNGHGEVLSQTSPDTGVTGFTYDPASNLKTKLDARAVQAEYFYDELNRITRITYPDETVLYTYDTCANGIGRLCSLSDRAGTTTWSYDLWGRVTSKSQTVSGLTQTVAYAYNAAGQLAQVTTPSGQVVEYGYANSRPVSVKVNGKTVLDQVFYEPFGPNGGWRWGNSSTGLPNYHTRMSDLDFRVSDVSNDLPAVAGVRKLSRVYSWDDMSRVASITDIADAALSATYDDYDALDRLKSVHQGASAWGYTFDGVGNRETATTNGASTTYTYFPGTHRLQSLTGAQAKSYSFDAAGNMSSDGLATWTYGGNNRPTQVQAGATISTFAINALGQRVRKTTGAGSTRFMYDEAGRLLGEYADDGSLLTETIWLEDLPVAVVSAQTRQAGVNDDFNGDASPDALFRNSQSGDTVMWLVNPDHSFGTAVFLGTIPTEFDLVGMADFNGDGSLDLLWRNSVTGDAFAWLYEGTQYVGSAYLFTPPPSWKVAAIADFNADGKADIVLRDTVTNTVAVYYFDGTQYLSGEYLFTLDPQWKIAGAADIDRNGKADFVVESTLTRDVGVMYMNGAQYVSGDYIFTIPSGFDLTHVADYNGDLNADIVLRHHDTGVAYIEYLNGVAWIGDELFFNVDPVWQHGPAGEAYQKAAALATPLVNRPLPPGFAKPSPTRRQGAAISAPMRLASHAPLPMASDLRRQVAPGPTPPQGKALTKVAGAVPLAVYYVYPDHLGTPRAITRPVDNKIVWRWDNTEPFGNSAPNENPSGLGAFAFNLRFPGQYFDQETGTHYNYYRDFDPSIGRYIQSDPIGLKGGLNTFAYAYDSPLTLADPLGLLGRGSRGSSGGYWKRHSPCGNGVFSGPEFSFREACIEHDQCYDTCRSGKAMCDERFCKQLKESCSPSDAVCKAAAASYCFAVTFAPPSWFYDPAQEKACRRKPC